MSIPSKHHLWVISGSSIAGVLLTGGSKYSFNPEGPLIKHSLCNHPCLGTGNKTYLFWVLAEKEGDEGQTEAAAEQKEEVEQKGEDDKAAPEDEQKDADKDAEGML